MQKIIPGPFLAFSLLALFLLFSMPAKVSPSRLNDKMAVPTPTYRAAIVQNSAGQIAITPTPVYYPTDIPTDRPTGGPPLSLTLTLLFTCCALGLVLGVLAIGFFISMQKRKEENKEKGS